MEIELTPARDSMLIENLFQYYLYDMSEYMGWSPDVTGSYAVDSAVIGLHDYWQKDGHYPYLILCDGNLADFSLLRRYPFDPDYHDIGQFFVLRKYQRQGVGVMAFRQSVSQFPGHWLTRVLPHNFRALCFWRKVITDMSVRQPVEQEEDYGDKKMVFIRYEIEPLLLNV
ncbi:GNAT family N-acetyltransferase [Gynuella sp.]|uniref:GNAT family N-acetyltransferase n=1 Tax=Gynuella sp. TaxID=2969146 RepID=UPI003D0A3282